MEKNKHTEITWSVRMFAENVGVSMPTAYAMTNEPGFPVLRVGRRKLIIASEVENWLRKRSKAQGE